jgi:23S rRNA pseudouridine1911/1915/1917 synthase
MTDTRSQPQILRFTAAPDAAGERVDVFLARAAAPLSRSRLKTLILSGQVSVDGRVIADVGQSVRAGAAYEIHVPPLAPALPEPEDIPLDILFEDAHLIVLNKPSGLAVHPAPGSETGTLVHALLAHCKDGLSGIGGVERPGIVHRLDKLTSGVMVAAKSQAAHLGLAAQFQDHSIERTYMALVHGAPRPRSGTIETRLARSTSDRKKIAVVKNPEAGAGRNAITHYRTLEDYGEKTRGTGLPAAALVACTLETGRTHQVRVHMAHIGCPLIGDPVYGKTRGIRVADGDVADAPKLETARQCARAFERQALHAAVLAFEHPVTGKRLRFDAPLPEDMQRLKTALAHLPQPK